MNIELTAKNLETNGYKVHVFDCGKDAVDFLKETIKGETVGFGGSKTIMDMGLYDALKEDNTLFWHWKNPKDRNKFAEFTCYISSANAVSQTGELVNIDGTGNRLASTLYGGKTMYFIVGQNKLCDDLQSAVKRARNFAAPLNAKRFNLDTPCVVDGVCHDCKSKNRICNALTVYMRPMGGFNETHVCIIKENFGF